MTEIQTMGILVIALTVVIGLVKTLIKERQEKNDLEPVLKALESLNNIAEEIRDQSKTLAVMASLQERCFKWHYTPDGKPRWCQFEEMTVLLKRIDKKMEEL